MLFRDIPANLITGFLGAGKTTAIRHLLDHKPADERWAVLVNEFGEVGVDGALLEDSGVSIKEIPGGCLCCVGSQSMQVGLAALIREANPQRILIEPTGLGHPLELLRSLTTGYYAGVLSVGATITLLDARQLRDPRYLEHPAFLDQMHLADVLVANKADTYSEADHEAFVQAGKKAEPAKAMLATVEQGRIDPVWLDLPRVGGRRAAFPEAHRFLKAQAQAAGVPEEEEVEERPPWYRVENRGEGHQSCGWIVEPDRCFQHDQLLALLQVAPVERVKAVLPTDQGWWKVNLLSGDGEVQATEARADGRVELIVQGEADWLEWDEKLKACLA